MIKIIEKKVVTAFGWHWYNFILIIEIIDLPEVEALNTLNYKMICSLHTVIYVLCLNLNIYTVNVESVGTVLLEIISNLYGSHRKFSSVVV